MRILVVGGTRFVGRHIVDAALRRGHEVTLLHRGGGSGADADPFPQAEHLHADRDGDLSVLQGRSFDATVDVCAYVPRQVRTLAAALDGRGGHHAYVSSVSAYAPPPGPGAMEDAPLAGLADPATEEVTGETYGGLKALCEQVAAEAYGPSLLVIRPTYVVGPYDPTGRFTYWVHRLARGGEVLAPGPQDSPVQVVDARDQGEWVVRLLEDGVSGTFNAVGTSPGYTFEQLLEDVAAAVAPEGTRLRWLGADQVAAHGLHDGRSLPLWSGEDADRWISAVSNQKALASGLAPRPVQACARDVLAHAATPLVPGVGLDPGREREVLASNSDGV
ncbi:MAG: NAD-dependent epimerase/dehydratase family protein [Motilibacteraceae bacterium]